MCLSLYQHEATAGISTMTPVKGEYRQPRRQPCANTSRGPSQHERKRIQSISCIHQNPLPTDIYQNPKQSSFAEATNAGRVNGSYRPPPASSVSNALRDTSLLRPPPFPACNGIVMIGRWARQPQRFIADGGQAFGWPSPDTPSPPPPIPPLPLTQDSICSSVANHKHNPSSSTKHINTNQN